MIIGIKCMSPVQDDGPVDLESKASYLCIPLLTNISTLYGWCGGVARLVSTFYLQNTHLFTTLFYIYKQLFCIYKFNVIYVNIL